MRTNEVLLAYYLPILLVFFPINHYCVNTYKVDKQVENPCVGGSGKNCIFLLIKAVTANRSLENLMNSQLYIMLDAMQITPFLLFSTNIAFFVTLRRRNSWIL
jgi:hypothetical protein